jgi:hypothetical protein
MCDGIIWLFELHYVSLGAAMPDPSMPHRPPPLKQHYSLSRDGHPNAYNFETENGRSFLKMALDSSWKHISKTFFFNIIFLYSMFIIVF